MDYGFATTVREVISAFSNLLDFVFISFFVFFLMFREVSRKCSLLQGISKMKKKTHKLHVPRRQVLDHILLMREVWITSDSAMTGH